MAEYLLITGDKYNKNVRYILSALLVVVFIGVMAVSGWSLQILPTPKEAVKEVTVNQITAEVLYQSSYTMPLMVTVLRDDGSYSFAKIENGVVMGSRLFGLTQLTYQNGDSGLVEEKSGTIDVFVSKNGVKETAKLVERAVTGITLADGQVLPVKVISGKIVRGKLMGDFEMASLTDNSIILGKFDTRGNLVQVEVRPSVKEPDRAASLIGKELLILSLEMQTGNTGSVLAATTDEPVETTGTTVIGETVGASFFQVKRNLDDGSVSVMSAAPAAVTTMITPSFSGDVTVDSVTGLTAIGSGVVTGVKIANGAISETQLANDAVVESRIKDGAVTSNKISDGTISDTDISGSAAISDGKLSTITTAGKVSGSAVQLAASGGLINSSGLSLLTSCASGEVLQWNGSAWVCAAVSGGGSGVSSLNSLTGALTIAGGGINSVSVLGSTITVTGTIPSLDPTYFTTANISQWTNNSGYITDGNTNWDNSYGFITASSSDILTNKTIAAGSNTITGLTNSNLSGTAGITDANLAQITTGNKVAGSAVQLNANGGIVNNTGLSLLTSCGSGEILKWSGSAWGCAADNAGAGALTARESDGSPSINPTSTLEFGPSSTSSAEFVVTDQTGGVVRVRLGDKVVMTDASQTLTNKIWNGSLIGLSYGGTNKDLTPVNGGIVWTDTDSMEVSTAGTAGQILSSNGTGAPSWVDTSTINFWQRNSGALSPQQITNALILGATATSSAIVSLPGTTNNDAFLNLGTGKLGIGTTTPSWQFSQVGNNAGNIASIFNANTTDSTTMSALRIAIGTTSTTNNARFVQFYAGATTDSNGTGVGRIKLNNNAVQYQSGGADVAEYMTVPASEGASAGDIIAASTGGNVKATSSNNFMIGVVSDTAAFVGNATETAETDPNKRIVGVAGFVSTKVTGDIAIGDAITAGSTAGVGVKATKAGYIIGKAAASHSGGGTDRILVSVLPGWYDPQALATTTASSFTISGNDILDSNGDVVSRIGAFEGIYTRDATISGTITLPNGVITNNNLANSSLTVSAGTGLSGGGLVSLGGTTTLSLPNVGTSGTYGGAASIPVITTDSQGRITNVTLTVISGLGVSNFTSANISQWTNNSGYITDGNTNWDNLYDLITSTGSAVLTNKTIAAGSNTISGLTNSNLSGTAGITDANLAQLTTANKVAGSAVQLNANGGITNSTGLTLLTTCATNEILKWSGSAWACATDLSGGSPAFSGIASGTNTTAAMVVGTGASLNYSGTGTINASSLAGATFASPGAIGSGTPNTGVFTTLTGNSSITSTGLLTATNGLTMTTGTLSLTSTSGSINSTGLTGLTQTLSSGTAAITAPTLNLNTSSTGNTAIGNATGTFALTSNGGLNVTTGGALIGVASIDTIGMSATTLSFAGAGSITSNTTNSLTLDTGSTGSVLIGAGVAAKTITVGNSNDDTLSINSSAFTVSTTGAVSGVTSLTAQSGNFTNTTNQLVLGTTNTTTISSTAPSANRTATIPALTASDEFVFLNQSGTLTNKTIAAGSNTISGLTNSNLSGTAGITDANLATISTASKVSGSAVQLNANGGITNSTGLTLLTTCNSGELLKWNGSAWACAADTSGGSPSLNTIAAASGANTIANGDNAQVWNWALTTVAKTAFTFGETSAATNGAGSQYILGISTLASSTAGPLKVSARGSTIIDTTSTGGLTFGNTTANTAITLQSGTGNINIGTDANAKTITIGNSTGATALQLSSGTGGINIGTAAVAKSINIGTGAAAQTVSLGSTNGASQLTLSAGTGGMYANGLKAQASGNVTVCINATTHLLYYGLTSSCQTSSETTKHNIEGISLGLDAVMALRPVSFEYNGTNQAALGFIAEEVALIDERPVERDINGNVVGLNYDEIVPILARGIQELDIKVDNQGLTLGEEISSLSGQIAGATTVEKSEITVEGVAKQIAEAISKTFNNVVEFMNKVIFRSDVAFLGRPTFNKDTAGFATVLAGGNEVEVTFEKEYIDEPIVTVTAQITGGASVADIPGYAVADVNTKGFKIRLSRATGMDIRFAWMALAVANKASFQGNGGEVVVPTVEITPTPTGIAPPAVTVEVTPSPTPTVEITPAPTEIATQAATVEVTPEVTPSPTPTPTEVPVL